MSDTLDERVVKLEFDNSKFEKNVKQTRKSLDQLDEQLAFKNGSDGIKRVEASFSHFQAVAFTVVSRITNRVIDLGINLVKALSVDNISAGWDKFGQKTTSVATMAAQKIRIAGKVIDEYSEKMEVINEQLDKLNWFTDETSYNFTDMVNNIGKFTAAGRDLDESVNAMMGIANWAALAGQNASTASHVMYQLSQALGRGYIMKQDWNSVMISGMDMEEFRERATKAAISLGELTKEGDKFITKTGKKFSLSEFTESLSSKWLTTDVLIETLSGYSSAVERLYEICEEEGITATEAMEKYGDELDKFGLKALKASQEARTFVDVIASVKDAVSTGWMNTAEKIFGGYDESKALWSELADQLYDVFAEGGNFRNEVLGLWRDLGGNKNVFGTHGTSNQGAFWNIYDSIIAVRNLIKEAWTDVFNISSFTESSERAQDIAEQLNKVSETIREITNRLKRYFEENLRLKVIFQGLFNILRAGLATLYAIKYALSPVFYMVKDLISYFIDKLSAVGLSVSKMNSYFSSLESIAIKVNNVLTELMDALDPRGILNSVVYIFGLLFKELSNYHPIEFLATVIKDFVDALKLGGLTSEDFQAIIGGLASLMKMVAELIIVVTKTANAYLVPVLKSVIRITNFLMGFITGFLTKVLSFIGKFFVELDKLISTGNWNIEQIGVSISNFAGMLQVNLQALKPLLESTAKLGAAILNILTLIPTLLSKISKAITGRGILDNFKWLFDKITEFFISFKESLEDSEWSPKNGIFAPLTALAKGLVSFIKGIVSILGPAVKIVGQALNFLGIILQSVGDFLNDFIGIFDGEKAKTVLNYMTRFILILGLLAIQGMIVYNMFYAILGVIKGWKYVTTALGDAISAYGTSKMMEAIASIITSISKALLALSVAVVVIANVPEEGFIRAVATIGSFIVIIGGLIAAILLLNKKLLLTKTDLDISKKGIKGSISSMTTVLQQISAFMISLSVALISFTLALAIISALSPEKAWSGAGILLTFMAVITGMVIALTKFGPKNDDTETLAKDTKSIKKSIKLISAMSLACFTIARMISKLGKLDPNEMWRGIAGFSTTLAAIAAFIVSLNLSFKFGGVDDGKIKELSYLFAALSLLMLALSAVVAILSTINTERAWIGIGQISTLFAALILMCISLNNFTKAGVFDYANVSRFLIGLSVALLSISGSIAILTTMDVGSVWMSILEITAMLAVLTGMCIALSRLAGDSKFDFKMASHFFISLSIMLLTLSGVIAILNVLDVARTWISIAQITTLLGALSGMAVGIGILISETKLDFGKISRFFIVITSSVLALSAVLAIMNAMDATRSWISIAQMITVIGAFAGIPIALSRLTSASSDIKSYSLFFAELSGCLLVIAAALAIMNKMDPKSTMISIGGIIMLLTALTALTIALMNAPANAEKVKQTIAIMATIAGQMLVVSTSLLMLSNVPWQTILAATLAIPVILASLTAIAVVLMNASTDGNKVKNALLMMAGMGGELLVISTSLLMLSNVPWQSLLASTLALSAVLVVFGATIKILGSSKITTASIKNISYLIAFIGAMSAELLVVSASLLILKNVPWQSMLASVLALSAMLLIFIASMNLIAASKLNPVSMIALATGIVVLSASLIPFSAAMSMMEQVTWMSIIKGLVLMASAMVLLIGAATILGPSVTMVLALGAAVTLLGLGMFLAATSLQVFATSLPEFMESIVSNSEVISTALEAIGPMMVTALISAFKSLLDNLTEIMPSIVALASAILNGMLTVLENDGPRLVDTAVSLIDSLLKSLADHSDSIINSLGTILKAGLDWLTNNVSDITNDLIDVLLDVIRTLTTRISEIIQELCTFLIALINALFDGIGPVLKTLLDRTMEFLKEFIPLFIKDLLTFVHILTDAVLLLIADIIKLTIATLGTLGKLMLDLLAGIILLVVQVSVGLTKVLFEAFRTILYNAFDVLSQVLIFMATDIPKLIGGALGRLLGAIIEYIGDLINQNFGAIGGLFGLGDWLKGLGKGMSDAANKVFDEDLLKGKNVINALNTARNNIDGTIKDITSNVTEDVNKGVEEINGALQSSLATLANMTSAYQVGENVGKGMAEGIEDSKDDAGTSAEDAAKFVTEAAKEELGEHSPSKVFAEIGSYMMQGLALGIGEESITARQAAIDAINDTISTVKEAVASDVSNDIVIRPVLDLSDVSRGAESISSIMSNVSRGRISVGGTLADSIQSRTNANQAAVSSENQNGGTTVVNNETYSPVFNIASNDPEGVAREVDIRLQRMRVQSNLAKGGAK